jgi:opacity protein-like surface antigen
VKTLLVLIGILFFLASTQLNAGEIEVSPFIGYRFGGGFSVTDLELARIDFKSGVSFGASAGYIIKDKYQFEFMWSRQKTELDGKLLNGNTDLKIADANFDQYHFDFLYNLGEETKQLRPFILGGVGASHLSPDGGVTGFTKVSYDIGAGIKYYFSKQWGLRLQGRYTPTYVNSTDNQVICDQFGCFIGTDRHYISQGDVSAGAFFHF